MENPVIRQTAGLKQYPKLIAGIKQAQLLAVTERDFAGLLSQIEEDPLFKKLAGPDDCGQRVITWKRFPKTGACAGHILRLEANLVPETSSFDLAAFMAKHKQAIELAKSLGLDKFRDLFLLNQEALVPEVLAGDLGLKAGQIMALKDLVDAIALESDNLAPSSLRAKESLNYVKVAKIEPDNGNFLISFYSPHLAKGGYVVDYEKLEGLRGRGFLSPEEFKKARVLLGRLEAFNFRKSILYRIISGIIEKQAAYLVSRDEVDLAVFLQKDMAQKISVAPSMICRAICGRSLELPWGREKALKDFFVNEKQRGKNLLVSIQAAPAQRLSDSRLAGLLKQKYGLAVSRRSIVNYRQELGFASGYRRNK
ncbi:MAG: hypothetical protein HY747_08680 [Elusimicrobia bacterium]|nr:hypothetical protein [Elusimicrobiota bacterium]